MSNQVQLIARVSPELKRKTKMLAAMKGLSVSQTVAELLQQATQTITLT